jgi:predicted metalloendopeptidase
VAAFGKRVDKLDWMAPATRAQAKEKLKTLYVGVGYPDRWKSYAGLKVDPKDAFGNALRAEAFHTDQEFARLHAKPDRTDWSMPPQLVNAVNLPLQNALNFPAAILQPPFFDRRHHRPRDQPQLRRPGLAVRCPGPPARLVDERGHGTLQGRVPKARRTVQRV